MKKTLLALTVLILACSLPVTAARTLVAPITHPLVRLSQSYPGNSEGTNLQFRGYDGAGTDVISSVPGIFSITPGTDGRTLSARPGKAFPTASRMSF